jgi:hypothetical protein
MRQSAADIDIAPGAIKHQRDDGVHEHAGGGHKHHGVGLDVFGLLDSAEGFEEDEKGDHYERSRVDQGSQNPGPMISVGFGRAGRPRLQINRDQRKKQRQEIGKIVSGLGQQGEGMGANPGHYQQQDIG